MVDGDAHLMVVAYEFAKTTSSPMTIPLGMDPMYLLRGLDRITSSVKHQLLLTFL